MTVQVARAQLATAATSSPIQIANVRLATSPSYVQIADVRLATVGTAAAPVLASIPDQTADGWDTVTITAHSTPPADRYTFTPDSPVTVTTSGATATFQAPPDFDGTIINVTVVATAGGLDSRPVTARVTVKPWSSWLLTSTLSPGDTIEGTGTDVIDGGTPTTPATDVIDGTGASVRVAAGWVPRRPAQPIGT